MRFAEAQFVEGASSSGTQTIVARRLATIGVAGITAMVSMTLADPKRKIVSCVFPKGDEFTMASRTHWIDGGGPGRLAIMARPRAGDWLDDEISRWRAEDIDVVVSLLDEAEIDECGLRLEAKLCRRHSIDFVAFPIPDRGVPASFQGVAALCETLVARMGRGQSVAIHCRVGIGRSALIAASVLVYEGCDPARAFARIGDARGVVVPDTEAQRDWVETFRDFHRERIGDSRSCSTAGWNF